MADHTQCGWTRRQTLRSLVGASLALPAILSDLLGAGGATGASAEANPLAPKPPHFPPRAKRVIFLHMSGGVSHVDTFDPKPKLFADHGKKFGNNFLKRPNWGFQARASCDTEVSDLFPHLGARMDDICLIRSMRCDQANHFEAALE